MRVIAWTSLLFPLLLALPQEKQTWQRIHTWDSSNIGHKRIKHSIRDRLHRPRQVTFHTDKTGVGERESSS